MCAVEFEIRLTVVVKAPKGPAVGVVARLAICPQTLLVRVVIRMTRRTGAGRSLKNLGYVAFFTRDNGVLSDERKRCQVMIEPDVFRPTPLAVAVFAALSQPALVNIIGAVAVVTAGSKLLLADGAFVTGFAFQSLVFLPQREFRIPVMIELDCFPLVGLVTCGAVGTVAPFMDIVICMTGKTIMLFVLLLR